jgi:hypothetical protein
VRCLVVGVANPVTGLTCNSRDLTTVRHKFCRGFPRP